MPNHSDTSKSAEKSSSVVYQGQIVGEHGATRAALLGIRGDVHSRVQEEAVDDQLPAAVEEIEEVALAVGALEAVVLIDRDHGQPAALSG
jgi:hypothetical protein